MQRKLYPFRMPIRPQLACLIIFNQLNRVEERFIKKGYVLGELENPLEEFKSRIYI